MVGQHVCQPQGFLGISGLQRDLYVRWLAVWREMRRDWEAKMKNVAPGEVKIGRIEHEPWPP